MRKILSVLLCFIILLSSVSSMAADEFENNYEMNVLNGLNIIDASLVNNPKEEISRGDFVSILMKMIDAPEETKLMSGTAKDLSTGSSYYSAMVYAINQNYVVGYGNGVYKPGETITLEESAAIILKIAGYTYIPENSGYMNIALSNGLMKGIDRTNVKLTNERAAKLLYNTLFLDVRTISNIEGNKVTYEENESFMENFMDMKRYRGIITSTPRSSLTGESICGLKEIAIDDVVFNSDYTEAESYLGYNVEAFVKEKEKNEYTLIFAIPYKTNVTDVKTEDIETLTRTHAEYETESGDKIKKININADADFLLNGIANPTLTPEHIIEHTHSITFIDNNDDGKIEVVIAYEYDEMYVGAVSVSNSRITNKYTYPGAVTELELEDIDELSITVDGAEANLDAIKVGYILTIENNNSGGRTRMNISASSKSVSGIITQYNTQENSVKIDDKEYKLSDMYLEALKKSDNYAENIKVGSSYTCYFNVFGKIGAIKIENETKRYGFMKKAFVEDDIEEKVIVKLLDSNGDWRKYELKNTIRLNNNSVKKENIFFDDNFSTDGIIAKPQMIEYELTNDYKIKTINTARMLDSTNRDIFRYKNIDKIYRSANNSFDSQVYISGKTVTFSIPSRSTGMTGYFTDAELSQIDDKYFVVNTGSIYSDWGQYSVSAYNCDKFGETELIVRNVELESVGNLTASGFLLDTLEWSVNEDDLPQMVLNGLHGTNIGASVPVEDNVSVQGITGSTIDISQLSSGDMLELYLDADSKVYRIVVKYSAENSNPSKYTGSLHENEVLLYGTVSDIDYEKGFITINDGLAEEKTIKLYTKKLSLYKFDTTKKRQKIDIGNITSISIGDFVLLKGGQSSFATVVIYKK